MPKRPGTTMLEPREKLQIRNFTSQGFSAEHQAELMGRHPDTIRKEMARQGISPLDVIRQEDLPGPIPPDQLSPAAARGLEDFEFFRLYFFGHVSRPWQIEAAETFRRLLATPDREYLVLNAPSGAGKTTFKIDLAAWLIVRDRGIRGLFGSDVATNANRDLARLRRAMERVVPAKAKEADLRYGAAYDALGCLAIEYGRFKPFHKDTWRDDAIIVEQATGAPITEREPTWSAYGRDSGVLSNRFNCGIWDDLVTKTNTYSPVQRDRLRHDYDTEMESRLEPGGLQGLIGQRMGPDDLYRYKLDSVTEVLGVDGDGNEVVLSTKPKYHHISYRAHDETKCMGGANRTHLRTAKPWPDGCLLDPVRLPWVDLKGVMMNNVKAWALMYQQEDADPEDVLVQTSWIEGTEDEDGVHPGCLDRNRGFRELPPGIRGPLYNVSCVDPSASKWWGITRWTFASPSSLRFLMDLSNERMEGPALLDWDPDLGCHTGLMEDWQQASVDDGLPITHWIIETVAFQKWLIQYSHFQTWMQRWPGVSVIPHSKTQNKLDKALGVPTLSPLYRAGLYRLPYSREAQPRTKRLVTQLTRWSEELARAPGHRQTEDLVMSNWFLEIALPRIVQHQQAGEITHLFRPSWMGGRRNREEDRALRQAESPYEAALREARAGG